MSESSLRLVPVGEVHPTATDALAYLRELDVIARDAGAYQSIEDVPGGFRVVWTVPADPVPLTPALPVSGWDVPR